MRKVKSLFFVLTTIFLCTLMVGVVSAQAKDSGIKGWEVGSEYNSYYNPKELDKIRGKIVKFTEVTPLPGMAKGTAFYFDEGDGEKFLVHVCPTAYADDKGTGLKKGIKTKIRGSWALINDEDVFIASKIKQGEHFVFKVRLTKDGKPFWTMGQEELAKELALAE